MNLNFDERPLTIASTDVHDYFNDRFPTECVMLMISSVPNFSTTAQVCRLWAGLSLQHFWNEVFATAESREKLDDRLFRAAASKLSAYLLSSYVSDKEAETIFFRRLKALGPSGQMKLIRNIFHSMNPLKNPQKSFPFNDFLIQLYNHPLCPTPSRLRIVQYVKGLGINVLSHFDSHHTPVFDAVFPRTIKPFSCVTLSRPNADHLSVHAAHTFQSGEIVGVVENEDVENPTLCYGWVEGKKSLNSNLWKIYLQVDAQGKKSRLCLKEPREIGKLAKECELPDVIISSVC